MHECKHPNCGTADDFTGSDHFSHYDADAEHQRALDNETAARAAVDQARSALEAAQHRLHEAHRAVHYTGLVVEAKKEQQ